MSRRWFGPIMQEEPGGRMPFYTGMCGEYEEVAPGKWELINRFPIQGLKKAHDHCQRLIKKVAWEGDDG